MLFFLSRVTARPLLYNDQILIFILFGGAQEGNERGELSPAKSNSLILWHLDVFSAIARSNTDGIIIYPTIKVITIIFRHGYFFLCPTGNINH